MAVEQRRLDAYSQPVLPLPTTQADFELALQDLGWGHARASDMAAAVYRAVDERGVVLRKNVDDSTCELLETMRGWGLVREAKGRFTGFEIDYDAVRERAARMKR